MQFNNHTRGTPGLCIFQLGWPGSSLQTRTNHGQGRNTKALSSAQVQQPYNMSAVLFLQGQIGKLNGSASASQGHSSIADPERSHNLLSSCSCISFLQAPDFQSSIYPCRGSPGNSLVMINTPMNYTARSRLILSIDI